MPTYEYECPGEGQVIEIQLPFDHQPPDCPKCGTSMTKVYNVPGIKFNAPGFYSTGG